MKNVYTKIFQAQNQFLKIEKNATNPFYKKGYSDLNSIMSSILPALRNNGLVISHQVSLDSVQTLIVDVDSGESVSSSFPLPHLEDPQKLGIAITYGRRYNISALLNLLSEFDDDSNDLVIFDCKNKMHLQLIKDGLNGSELSNEDKKLLITKLQNQRLGDLKSLTQQFLQDIKESTNV